MQRKRFYSFMPFAGLWIVTVECMVRPLRSRSYWRYLYDVRMEKLGDPVL